MSSTPCCWPETPRPPPVPELPEVETVRRDLQHVLGGAIIKEVEVTGLRSTRRYPSQFVASLEGRSFERFDRWGKYLLMRLAPGTDVLVTHLRMSGQLLLAASADEPMARHTHVVLTFTDGRQLRFVDPRTFGEMFVTTGDLPELGTLGLDALTVSLDEFAGIVSHRRARLKPLLLDQRIVAGIGNIYSDEILWRARLRWYRQADRLRPIEVRRLHTAIVDVLAEAVDRRGSSLRDAQYVDLSGKAGTFQEVHAVYGREGLSCARCGHVIERTTVVQRSHFWCRGCQK
jgi:formamidopyrimidine-DNA glycosylase